MWHLITVDSIPKVFRFAIFGMITIILGAITYKVIDNFFMGGDPAHYGDGKIGFANFDEPVGAAYSRLTFEAAWNTCLELTDTYFDETEYLVRLPIKVGFAVARAGNDLVVASCANGSLSLFVASNDYTRASSLRYRIIRELKPILKNAVAVRSD